MQLKFYIKLQYLVLFFYCYLVLVIVLYCYYVNGDNYAKRVLEITNTQYKEKFGKITKQIKQGKISIKDLTCAYDEKRILDNINIELQPNSLNVLIGNSGSGKSTLFLLLCKIYEVIME